VKKWERKKGAMQEGEGEELGFFDFFAVG